MQRDTAFECAQKTRKEARCPSAPFLVFSDTAPKHATRTTKTTRKAKPDDVAVQVGQAEAHVPQGNRAPEGHEEPVVGARLHNGAHAALQRDLGEDVVAQVAQHSAGVGQLGAAQVDVVVRHHLHELKDLLPAGDEARAQHVVHAEGLGGRGGRRGGVVRRVRGVDSPPDARSRRLRARRKPAPLLLEARPGLPALLAAPGGAQGEQALLLRAPSAGR